MINDEKQEWGGDSLFFDYFLIFRPPDQKFLDKSMIKTVFKKFQNRTPQKSKITKKKRVPSPFSFLYILHF